MDFRPTGNTCPQGFPQVWWKTNIRTLSAIGAVAKSEQTGPVLFPKLAIGNAQVT